MAGRINSKSPQEITDYDLQTVSLYDLEGNITGAIQFLEELHEEYTKKGYHTVWMDVEGDGYDNDYFTVIGTRTETQKQVEARRAKWKKNSTTAKKAAEKRKQKKLKEERELYNKLKKQFGDE